MERLLINQIVSKDLQREDGKKCVGFQDQQRRLFDHNGFKDKYRKREERGVTAKKRGYGESITSPIRHTLSRSAQEEAKQDARQGTSYSFTLSKIKSRATRRAHDPKEARRETE